MFRAVAALGLVIAPALAFAEQNTTPAPTPTTPSSDHVQRIPRRIMVKETGYKPDKELAERLLKPAALSGHTIWVNRCVGGCAINPGNDDMTAQPFVSSIPNTPVMAEQATDLTEDEWADVMQCVREVYSPYDVKIVEDEPGPNVAVYSGIIVAGNDSAPLGTALGLPPDVGGVVSGVGCSANPRAVAYAFADNDNVNTFALEVAGTVNSLSRVRGLCWIIAQETAHAIGLDHSFAYADDNSSACNDPMTYRFECGGQKFFRNRFAKCGEFVQQGERPCQCGANQNTHLRLVNIYGEGTSIVPPPVATITTPAANSQAANSLPNTIVFTAGSERGVNRVELYINGFKWAQSNGAPFGRNGQPNPSNYTFQIPADVPDSIVDVQIKAFDDVEVVGESPIVTVVKGAAGGCQSADTCATGQKCEAGKCFWEPAVGEIGDDCTFGQFCLSGLCSNSVFQGDGICTQACVAGIEDACPAGLECVSGGAMSVCLPASDEGGCCSTSDQRTPWAPFVLGGFVLGFVVLRRRK